MTIIALSLTIIKILLDLGIYIIKQMNQKEIMLHNSEGKSCLYLQKNEKGDVCSNILFKKKMLNGICPRQKCYGFNTNIKIDNIAILNSSLFFAVKKIIDLFPEFAITLLAINEILSK